MARNLFIILCLTLLTACQLRTAKNQIESKDQISSSVPTKTDVTSAVSTSTEEPVYSIHKQKRFGFILTAGGVRSWAYIAFLKELQSNKVPVASIAGIEWGSVVAGLYAHSGSPNEVEWELSKFKKIDEWPQFLSATLDKKSTATNKIPFMCPSLNTKNKTAYVLNQGKTIDMVSLCIPSLGLIAPYANSIANVTELYSLAEYLKKAGADKIVLVSVLGGATDDFLSFSSSSDVVYWASAAAAYSNKKNTFIDDWITINLNGYKINDFENRKNILLKSEQSIKSSLQSFLLKYSLN